MKQYNYSPFLKMIGYSVALTFLILSVRIVFTGNLHYGNYFWNTILAAVPVLFSFILLRKKWHPWLSVIFFIAWLLFLPNAPYMITDLVHYEQRGEFPGWIDIMLVTTASWNGLLLGVLSLMMIEDMLHLYFKSRIVKPIMLICLLLCGYGIYLGRYLRYNTWDVLTNPIPLFQDSAKTVFYPGQHLRTWGFTLLFGLMYSIFYFTLKQLQSVKNRSI